MNRKYNYRVSRRAREPLSRGMHICMRAPRRARVFCVSVRIATGQSIWPQRRRRGMAGFSLCGRRSGMKRHVIRVGLGFRGVWCGKSVFMISGGCFITLRGGFYFCFIVLFRCMINFFG